MEILEAYDLVGTLRGAAALAGCDHKTVGHFVALREAAGGSGPSRGRARPLDDPYGEKIAEWVAKGGGAGPGRQGARGAGREGVPGVGGHDPGGGAESQTR